MSDKELLLEIWAKFQMCQVPLKECHACRNNIKLIKQLKKRLGIKEKIDLHFKGVVI